MISTIARARAGSHHSFGELITHAPQYIFIMAHGLSHRRPPLSLSVCNDFFSPAAHSILVNQTQNEM